jgi:hypothetical protein
MSNGVIRLNLRNGLCLSLIGRITLIAVSGSTVLTSLCQTINVSSTYHHQASPSQQTQVVTTMAGSCTSGGEDYFAVRVDLADSASKSILSSNRPPIGYNANNFSVKVENVVTTPLTNQTWPIDVDTFLLQVGE